jgi:quercetin dioxygenase-like cupin family protein
VSRAVLSRRNFARASFASLLAVAAASLSGESLGQSQGFRSASKRRVVIKQDLPGQPTRELTLVEVTYPPGVGSPPHVHANGVLAFVVSGTVESKVGDGAARTFASGEAWWEPPGAIHRVSRNASATEPATLLAIYIAPKGTTPTELMQPIPNGND